MFWLKFILEKNLSTLDCFSPHLVNVESMESCFVCLETAFTSKELCMKMFVAVADVEE